MNLEQPLEALAKRYQEITDDLGRPEVLADRALFQKLAKARADLEPIVDKYRLLQLKQQQLHDAQELVREAGEEDLRTLALEEARELEQECERLTGELKRLLAPKDPNDDRNVILEVRAGTGGEEAALFAQEVFRMYTKFAEQQGWRTEVLSHNATGVGGLKEVIALIEGRGAFSRLKYESGVHRVQRVPKTEASGRIHTSAITVAVLPDADEVEVQIDPDKDLRIDTYCSSGPGGQSVNTTYSAVRITHLPTGLVVSCQDEKSQIKNKAKALRVLRSRLHDLALREQQETIARERKGQIGSGDRSEKIRTYNFQQGRVTDHRINFTVHQLGAILDGQLGEMVDALATHYQSQNWTPPAA